MTPNQDPNHLLNKPTAGMDRDVPTDLGDGTIGSAKESHLLRLDGVFEDDNELTHWVQYHLPTNGRLVHRTAWVQLKHPAEALLGEAAAIG